MSLVQWFKFFDQAVRGRHGPHLAKLFSPVECVRCLSLDNIDEHINRISRSQPFSSGPFCFGASSFQPVVQTYLQLLRDLAVADPPWDKIVSHGTSLLTHWVNVLKHPESGPCCRWLFPGLMVICRFLTKAGYEADQKAESDYKLASELTGGEGDEMETDENRRQIEVLNSFRNLLGSFRHDEARQAAYVILITESIKACLTLRNMTLAQTFLKQIAHIGEIKPDKVPRVSMVAFKYYLGKLEMQREVIEPSGKAEKALLWAFGHCGPNSRLKKSILECLLVVRLQVGKIPSDELMSKYNLKRYQEIVNAVTKGNVKRFEEAMAKYWREFTDDETFFALERMKFLVYRTALKNTYIWARRHMPDPVNPHIMPIGIFTSALKWQIDECYADAFRSHPRKEGFAETEEHADRGGEAVEFDDEEMLCIFANLIKNQWIKGYVAWEHAKVVFLKGSDPFPPLRKIMTGNR